MMYNEKRKETFIKEFTMEKSTGKRNQTPKQVLINRFTETAQFEMDLNKDVCEWTVPEILDFYKSRVTRSLESLMMIHSHLNMYTQWCLTNAMIPDSQNHFTEIDREILNQQCVNSAYLDKGIVDRAGAIKLTKNPKILNEYERFLILALFEGIGGKGYSDFEALTMDNFKGDMVELPGRTIKVSYELINLAKASAEVYEYRLYGGVDRIMNYETSDKKIIKSKPNKKEGASATAFLHTMSVNIKRLKEECDTPAISSSMLFESGRLQMIRDFMVKDNIDAETAIKSYHEEISNQYGPIYAKARYLDKWNKYLELTD